MRHFSITLHSTSVATLTILSIFSFQLNAAPLPQVASVTVKTRAPQNELVTVWYRIPKNYHPRQKQMSRVLVLFGGRNSSGKDMASGGLEWGKWADENNAFLVSPGFKDDNYWEPEKWSGKALLNALEQIRKRYNICTDKLLFYGYYCSSTAILPEVSARTCFPPGDRSSPVPGCHTPAACSMNRQPECAPWPDL